MKLHKVIISGGGTGGHIFPALSIADEIKRRDPSIEVLFVGAKDRMEMEKVPQAGYKIEGLNISGLQRSLSLKNLAFPFKVLGSLIRAGKIIDQFKPQVAIGVGGYASGPLLYMAQQKGIPTLIQEQNSFPGITNKLLAKKVSRVCVAYEKVAKYFPADRVVLTGNPVRSNIVEHTATREEGCTFFQLDPSKPVVLSIGGSLGARSINHAIQRGLQEFADHGVQVIWQTGAAFYKTNEAQLQDLPNGIKVLPFITDMNMAYAAADMVISRAGALAISELCVAGKPCILVPSPYVAEDHQTHNALALTEKHAAKMVKEEMTGTSLVREAIALLNNPEERSSLSSNIAALAKKDATQRIADEIFKLVE